MKSVLTVRHIRLVANVVIAIVVVFGSLQVLTKGHTLITAKDEINIVRLDVPWYHPGGHVSILLDRGTLSEHPALHQEVQIDVFIYDLLKRVVNILLLVLILIYLKSLVISIRTKSFFEQKSIAKINRLALVVIAYVVAEFIFYQLIPVFIPVDLMVETVNFSTLKQSAISNIMAATDFKMLFVGICLYIISVSFRDGYQLKEQAELSV